MGSNIFVRTIPLPETVRAVTLPNSDCTFDIYINSRLPQELQYKALDYVRSNVSPAAVCGYLEWELR